MDPEIQKKNILQMGYEFGEGVHLSDNPDVKAFEEMIGKKARFFLTEILKIVTSNMVKDENFDDAMRHIVWIRDACNYIIDNKQRPKTQVIQNDNKWSMKI